MKKRSSKVTLGVILCVLVVFYIFNNNNESSAELEYKKAVVSLITPIEYKGGQSLSVIGNVRALSEARITSESAGRVTSVNASLGQQVKAGKVLVTLENASERAAVLQAEGVYEASLATAAQSDVGISEAENALSSAKNNAVSAFKSSYNTVNGLVINSIDDFFANPTDGIIGLKINGKGFTSDLNSSRLNLRTSLADWKLRTNTISNESDLKTELDYVLRNIQDVVDIVDVFLVIFDEQNNLTRYSDDELSNFKIDFTALRSTLITLQSSINSAETSLSTAEDVLKRAKLSATGGASSAADAQVKQALGSLRAAQAQYAKTILSTPVSGTVNSLSVRVGDFINAFSEVAIVANNNTLEIVAFLSDSEKDLISKGDTVLIENKYKGLVTEIAPAVDSITGKTEVRITTENSEISNGDTVRIAKQFNQESDVMERIEVPLTAIKFTRENGVMFTVSDSVLVSNPVVLGQIRGSSVEIIEGISNETEFVVDARGLVAGEAVVISQ